MNYKARYVDSLGLDIYYEFESEIGFAEQAAQDFIAGHNSLCKTDYVLNYVKCISNSSNRGIVENIEVAKSENEQYLTITIGESTGVLSIDDLMGFLDSEHDSYRLPNLINELQEE